MENIPNITFLGNGLCIKTLNKNGLNYVLGVSDDCNKLRNGNGLTDNSVLFGTGHDVLTSFENGLILVDYKYNGKNIVEKNAYMVIPYIGEDGKLYTNTLFYKDPSVESIDLLCLFPIEYDEDGHCIKRGSLLKVKQKMENEQGNKREYVRGVCIDDRGNVLGITNSYYTDLVFWKDEGIVIGRNPGGNPNLGKEDILSRSGKLQLEGVMNIDLNCSIDTKCYDTMRRDSIMGVTTIDGKDHTFIIRSETGEVLSELEPKFYDITKSIIEAFSIEKGKRKRKFFGSRR